MRESDRGGADAPRPARKPLPAARDGLPPARDGLPQARDGLPAARSPLPSARKSPPSARDTVKPSPPSPTRPVPVRRGAPPPSARRFPARRPATPRARDLGAVGTGAEPTREVRLGEETWTVRLKGAGRVGSAHAGARILSVGFEAPQDRADPAETRYVFARRLEDIGEDELLSLVREVARQPLAGARVDDPGRGAPGTGGGWGGR